MSKITVFNKKNNAKVLAEFAKLFDKTSNNLDEFYDDGSGDLHKEFLYWICKYAIKTYDVNFVEIGFTMSNVLNNAYCYDNTVVLPTGLINCLDFNEFILQSTLSIFHEVNHIYISELEKNFKKGLNGQKNLNLASTGASSIIEYLKFKKFSEDKIKLFKDLLYLNSTSEIYAFYSSCKLGMKFIEDLKKFYHQKNNTSNDEILDDIKDKLQKELEYYIIKIEGSKAKRKSFINQSFLNKTLFDIQDETIFDLLSNEPVLENKYDAFLTSIDLGIYNEKTIENYKKAILINEMGINKAKLFCDLINIPSYKIDETDLKTAIKLIESDEILKFTDNKVKLHTIKSVLSNIDTAVIDKLYKQMKGERNERLS